MTPISRKHELLVQGVGDEIVVYDERSHEAHRLNSTAALVWRMADGQRSLGALSARLRESLLTSHATAADQIDETASEELVRIALAELDRVGLLVHGLPALGEPISRREMIGVAAALLPVVASILAPTPAMAQTPPTTPTPANPFAAFNGTYTGPGSVDPNNNPCGFGNTEVITVLDLRPSSPFPFNAVSITHVAANQTFAFTPPLSIITVQSMTADSLIVEARQIAPLPGILTSTFAVLSFGRSGGVINMNGTQSFSGPCGTFGYSVMGTKR